MCGRKLHRVPRIVLGGLLFAAFFATSGLQAELPPPAIEISMQLDELAGFEKTDVEAARSGYRKLWRYVARTKKSDAVSSQIWIPVGSRLVPLSVLVLAGLKRTYTLNPTVHKYEDQMGLKLQKKVSHIHLLSARWADLRSLGREILPWIASPTAAKAYIELARIHALRGECFAALGIIKDIGNFSTDKSFKTTPFEALEYCEAITTLGTASNETINAGSKRWTFLIKTLGIPAGSDPMRCESISRGKYYKARCKRGDNETQAFILLPNSEEDQTLDPSEFENYVLKIPSNYNDFAWELPEWTSPSSWAPQSLNLE